MQVCEPIGRKYQTRPGLYLVKEIQWGNERVCRLHHSLFEPCEVNFKEARAR